MTPFKNFSKNSAWPSRLRRGGLYVAVATLLAASTGCGSNDNGADWEQVQVTEPTKGVVTTLEETEAGQFTITGERVVDRKDSSRVIIRRLDGSEEVLTLDQARGLVQPADTTQTTVQQHRYGHHGLGSVLWWGTMGYMMGRSFGSPLSPGIYRGGTGMAAADELRRTSVTRTEMRPVKGRSGFFGRGARGTGG